jgi:hypothetical protein
MTPLLRRPRSLFLLAACSATGVLACGASINVVYESEVRFEHCMALEELPEGKATTQKACWDEWIKYYTFGQTRDRVDYARMRQKRLSGESDFTEEAWSPPALAQRAVPEPTSVLAPPPMMITDAGASPDVGLDAAATSAPIVEPPAAACATTCREGWNPCKQACKNAACEKACERKYRACMKRCF